MFQALLDSTPTVIFLTIVAASFLFVAGSFLLGHGHLDHDHVHDHDHSSIDGGHEFSTISIFSPRMLALFGIAFGAGGSVASIYGLNIFLATLSGLFSGTILLLIGYSSLRMLHMQQVNSLVTDASLIGSLGHVVTRIPAKGWGEVTFLTRGQSMTQLATSAKHIELVKGTRIQIISVVGNAVEVEAVKDV